MRLQRLGFALAAGASVALLAACAGPQPQSVAPTPAAPPPNLTAPYAAAARQGTPVYRLDPEASQVLILVDKAGTLAGFGHVHVVAVGDLRGFARAMPNGGGRANLVFPVPALVVDPPAARSALGGEYAKVKISAEQRAGTRAHMLGSAVLDAAHYSWAALAISVPAAATGTARALTVQVRLRGVTRSLRAPSHYRITPARLRAAGGFTLRQTAFGIEPYSAFLGALRVKNEIAIRYHLVFNRWCPPHLAGSCSIPP